MTKRNATNFDMTSNSDGFDIAAGTTARTFCAIGGNVTMSAGGTYTYTFPGATCTLLGSTETTLSAATLCGTNLSAINVKATTVTATNLSAVSISATTITATSVTGATNIQSTNLCAGTTSATNLSGLNVKATTITGTTLSGTTFSGTNVYVTTTSATNICAASLTSTSITATNLTAVNISATTYQNVPAGTGAARKLILPAAAWETRIAAGWAAFTWTQGTNFDYGQYDFDKDTDEKINSAPFQLSSWASGAITADICWKTTAVTTTQSAVWVIQSTAMSAGEAFDAAFTQNASGTGTTPGAAGLLQTTTMTFTPANVANNDIVVLQLYRNADDATYDTISADVSLVTAKLEWT